VGLRIVAFLAQKDFFAKRVKDTKENIYRNKGCVVTLWPLPFTLKSILMQKKNYEKLKYFAMQKYNLQKKSSKMKPKSLKIL
jgi:hypothetical protein